MSAVYFIDGLDEVVIERIMAGALRVLPIRGGRGGGSTPAELVEAIQRLAARGWTDRQIGERVGLSQAAVTKQRARNAIASGVVPGVGAARRCAT